jgi:hypothetical protein
MRVSLSYQPLRQKELIPMLTADIAPLNIVDVTPATYARASLKDYEAVTFWSPETGYVTINNPESVFADSRGGLTVRGLRGTGTTVKSKSHNSFLVGLFPRKGTDAATLEYLTDILGL